VLRHNSLDVGGEYAYRMRGEEHVWTPDRRGDLQHAVRGNVPGEVPNTPAR
jgi:glutamate synthase (NADPH/NADH) large chain